MNQHCFLGIDAGTQGLSVVLTDNQMNILATGEGAYEMIAGLKAGCYEQNPDDWITALQTAMDDLRSRLPQPWPHYRTMAIGISAQMHGEVLVDAQGNALGPARLWCDGRNEAEGTELTEAFGVKMPQRITAARWLATVRTRPELARKTAHVTTPAGWIAYQLTREWNLGIGDASGMFPIDQATLDYDRRLLDRFEQRTEQPSIAPLSQLLPTVRTAGESGGTLHPAGGTLLDLPAGIPVAPAEGDQPASLAGSLIGSAGMVAVSFGTSVCANSVGDRPFQGVSPAIDHFCAADGKPINMVWLRNGTTFMNQLVEMFGACLPPDTDPFASLMPRLLEAESDCGGLLALPFMDDEPGLGVTGGNALLIGLNRDNATPGNVLKASLLATMFNLRKGCEVLDAQGYPRKELILSGGLTRTPELGQILADVLNTPVRLLTSSQEGCAWGAAILAHYRHHRLGGSNLSWSQFLDRFRGAKETRFIPTDQSKTYASLYERYQQLLASEWSSGACTGASEI